MKRAEAGEDIVIANHRKPMAMITRLPSKPGQLPWNVLQGKVEMTEDFDAPLDEFQEYS